MANPARSATTRTQCQGRRETRPKGGAKHCHRGRGGEVVRGGRDSAWGGGSRKRREGVPHTRQLLTPYTVLTLADEGGRTVREAAGDLFEAAPVLLVNGRHLIVGSRFEKPEHAYQTANTMIRREVATAR